MSDHTGDPTWDGGWEDGVERGDSLEQWMLEREPGDELGRSPGARSMRALTDPDD